MLGGSPPGQRRLGYWAVGSALLYFFLLGPIAIKTRFHDFVWVIFAALAALAYTKARESDNRQKRWWHIVYWVVAAGIIGDILRAPAQGQSWTSVIVLMSLVGAMVALHVRGRAKLSPHIEFWRLAVCGVFIFLALAGMADSISRKLILPG
jgi:hypothetical protein